MNIYHQKQILLERSSAATGTSRRDNVTSKREVKSLLTFGSQTGPTYEDWAADFTTALEHVCKEIVLITECVDKQPTVESIAEAEFKDTRMEQQYHKAWLAETMHTRGALVAKAPATVAIGHFICEVEVLAQSCLFAAYRAVR